jgi:hypothetical protein
MAPLLKPQQVAAADSAHPDQPVHAGLQCRGGIAPKASRPPAWPAGWVFVSVAFLPGFLNADGPADFYLPFSSGSDNNLKPIAGAGSGEAMMPAVAHPNTGVLRPTPVKPASGCRQCRLRI